MSADADAPPGELLAQLSVSAPRRVFAVGTFTLLGAMLVYLALVTPAGGGYRLMMAALGAGALWGGMNLYRATATVIVLTDAGLFEGTGRPVARLEEISKVDRGMFAFKPTTGFLVLTHASLGRHWAPGLWWRAGRAVGIGGVTSRHEAKHMGEVLAALLAARDGD